MKRYYVSDIRKDLLESSIGNKSVVDNFGVYFKKESDADDFIETNPGCKKYIIETEGRLIISLDEVYES